MAVRAFNGSTDNIVRSIGALSGMQYGTIVSLVKVANFSDFRTLFNAQNSSGDPRLSVYTWTPGGQIAFQTNADDEAENGFAPENEWFLVVVRKDTGNQTPRFSVYDYGEDDWTHANGNGTVPNATAPGASGTVQFAYEGFTDFNGRVAAQGVWANSLPWAANSSGDTAIEAAGLETALQNWFDETPDALWAFNQATVTETVDDLTGNGADQTSRSGTSVITNDDPPGFDFDLSGAVTGTAVADLGALVASATGQRLTYGTATADLAALTATATGQRLTYGSAEADLGILSASAQAATLVLGIATANLGQLVATATGQVSLTGTAHAGLGSLTAHARSSILIMGVASASLSGITAHATGQGTVARPRFILRGPTFDENLWTNNRLFIRYKLPRGITLVVSGQQVIELTYPYQADLTQYDRVYLGGRDHRITGAERELLVAAGYEDFIFPIEDLE